MLVTIEQCLNGYLLSIGELRIILSQEMHDELGLAMQSNKFVRIEGGTEAPKKKRKYTRREPSSTYKNPKINKYKCADCNEKFESTLSKLDVTCPACGGLKIEKNK